MPYADREEYLAYQGNYGRENRTNRNEYNNIWRNANPLRAMLSGARARAKKQGMEFSITEADLLPQPTHCPVLGIELVYWPLGAGKGKYRANSASIDRKDNSKGYVHGNVFIVSYRANSVKRDGTAEEHEAIMTWMRGNPVHPFGSN